MRSTEERIRRLEIWNRALVTLLLLATLGFGGKIWLDSKLAQIQKLTVSWQGSGEIRLFSITDSPMIVTHLVSHQTKGGKATATLPEPLAIHDSAGRTIDALTVNRLVWRDIYGKPVGAPVVGSELRAFYFRPIVAQFQP